MATTAQKYLQDFQNTINTNSTALKGIKEGYDTMYRNYASGLVNDGTFQAIENARQNSQDTTNRQYNDAARNYYSQYMQNQKALPERLSNLGVTGGATESAMLKLMNQYSGNLYQNQSARANALNNINMQYDQQIANNSKTIAQQLAETYLRLAQQARDEVLAEQEAARQAAYYSGGGGYYSDYGDYYGGYGDEDSSSSSSTSKAFTPSTSTAKYNETYGTTTPKKTTTTSSWTAPKVTYKPKNITKDTAKRYSGSHASAQITTDKKKKTKSGGGYSSGRKTNAMTYK